MNGAQNQNPRPNASTRSVKCIRSHSHISCMSVWAKATTALRRMENAAIPENLCLSLLTKEGSSDLEASDGLERDAMVNSFSLVLDEVLAQNWRGVCIRRQVASFDEFDMSGGAVGGRMDDI